MAYNNKEVLKDVNGNTIPQYYNPTTDSYEPLEGKDGSNKVIIFDANGSELVSTQVVQPIIDKLDQLTGTALAEENRKVFEGFDPLKQYYLGNKVAYEGSSYYVIVEPPIGTLPTNTGYFLLIAEKGDTGNGITNIVDNLDGTITITYGEGQTVVVEFIGNIASNISYNNATSGLVSNTVQGAIDEVNTNLVAHQADIVTDVEGIDARVSILETISAKTYGVRRVLDATSSTLQRLGDAVGLVANADNSNVAHNAVVNDFDSIYPWSHMRPCIITDNGKIYYEGEPGYSTAIGDWMIEVPEFHIKHTRDGVNEDIYVSGPQMPGYIKTDKFYVARFKTTELADASHASRPETFPKVVIGRTDFRTNAQAKGTG